MALTAVAVVVSGALVRADERAVREAPTILAQNGEANGNAAATSAASATGACAAPHQYVDLINAGQYDEIGGLFAEDAVYMGPDGKTRYGAKAIGEFYIHFLGALKPRVKPASFIQDGHDCVMELTNQNKLTGKYSLVAIDHFTVNGQGKISRFIVYLRPGDRFTQTINAALAKVH
jgi:ketosteroid isomerase-like protein